VLTGPRAVAVRRLNWTFASSVEGSKAADAPQPSNGAFAIAKSLSVAGFSLRVPHHVEIDRPVIGTNKCKSWSSEMSKSPNVVWRQRSM
jgi:hypothetical protein